MQTHITCRRVLAVALLSEVLTHEGHTALWYSTPTGATLVTDAPPEAVHHSIDLVQTAMRWRRGPAFEVQP